MKKFLIAQLAFALVFGSFVLAIIWPAEGWSNVAGVSIWLLNLLAMFTIAMVAGMAHSVRTGAGAKRDDALTALRKFTAELGKHSKLRKAWGWLQTLAMIIAAAFAGFTVSALLHGVLCFVVWLAKQSAETAVTEADAATPVHTVEDDFQHFLSYSGLGAVHPEVIELMRMAAAGKPYPRTCQVHGLTCGVKPAPDAQSDALGPKPCSARPAGDTRDVRAPIGRTNCQQPKPQPTAQPLTSCSSHLGQQGTINMRG